MWVDLFYAPAFSMNLPDHLYSCLKYTDSMIFTKEDVASTQRCYFFLSGANYVDYIHCYHKKCDKIPAEIYLAKQLSLSMVFISQMY